MGKILNIVIKIYTPSKGSAMVSPISSLVAEHFLLYFNNLFVKHNIDNKTVLFNTRYLDDILIIYDHTN